MFAWAINGVKIHKTVSANCYGLISGTGIVCRDLLIIPFSWEAYPLPTGYHVEVTNVSGRIWTADGATFNMLLEVAALARKSL